MNGERLFQILGLVDEDLVEEAESASFSTPIKQRPRRAIRLAAACAAVVCISGAAWLLRDGLYLGGASMSAPGSDTDGGGSGIAHNAEPLSVEGTTFMSYAGPVFPLTLAEEIEGLTAERTTIWDFAPDAPESGSTQLWGSTVTDTYLLMNHTTGDILATACYPVSGSFESFANDSPVVTTNRTETKWKLYSGNYVGSFTHAGIEDGSTWNLNPPHNWADYKAVLGDGTTYLNDSMMPAPSLDQPVTVYEFSDFVLPENAPRAATLAFDCTIDPDKTQILSYGFNGFWEEDDGWRRYDFFVPDGTRRKTEDRKLLILLGEDINGYTMQGYEDGGCDPSEILSGVSCTVSRRESTLEEVMNGICQTYAANFETDLFENPFSLISPDQFADTVKKLMLQHGVLAGDQIKDRYSDGRLDELVPEVLYQERILYLTFPISIPAGESVAVSVEFRKEPSFDYGCSGSENVGLQGYDLVTQLGSVLEFTCQTAGLKSTDYIKLSAQNFGFDPENGITEVQLDPKQEHYYLEIRPKH